MHSTLVDLQSFDLIALKGEDSKKFLQGQVSCNTDALTHTQSLSGLICNIKGRVVVDFRLFEYQQECFLQLPVGMAAVAKSILDKYIVFSKAETCVANNRFSRFGLIGNDAHSLLQKVFGDYPLNDGAVLVKEQTILIKVPGLIPRYEIWQEKDHIEQGSKIIATLRDQSIEADFDTWELEDVKAGIAHIPPSMTEEFLPEALNYDINGTIDFNKGCYTGQEIVARMFYRGSAKKRLYHLHLSSSSALESQITVNHLDNAESKSNEVIKTVRTQAGDCHVLAILPTEAVANDTRFFLNNQQEMQYELQPLPYQVE